VSEALLRLEFEGMLESRPRAGTRVRIPSREDVKGHYLVREILEAEAARRFAEHATASERASLITMAAKVDALSTKKDRGPYLALHHRLHSRIAECARCQALSTVIEQTCALSSTWFCLLPRSVAAPETGM
jgi:DNA-binding GntR family transcriptional regulator